MYEYTYIYMYIYIYVSVYICIHTHIYVYIYMYVDISHIYIYTVGGSSVPSQVISRCLKLPLCFLLVASIIGGVLSDRARSHLNVLIDNSTQGGVWNKIPVREGKIRCG